MFCRKSFQLTEPGIQLGEWLLAAYVVHWPRQEIRADVQFTDFENRKKEKKLRGHLVAFQFQILQNCGPYIWWANKVNGGFPLTPAAKESISPPLIPHAQIINPIKNSYLHIDINRYIYICLFLDQQIPLFYSEQNMWHPKLEYDRTPHTALLPLEEKNSKLLTHF